MKRAPRKYVDIMSPDDIHIDHLWTAFAGAVLHPAAPPIQRQEMRNAFYAGFCECFKIVTELSEDLTEEEACKVLSRIRNEAHDFGKRMVAKYEAGELDGAKP